MNASEGKYILQYIPAGFITRRELAELLGVSYSTVQRWEHDHRLTPTAYMEYESFSVPLYEKSKAEELARIIKEGGGP